MNIEQKDLVNMLNTQIEALEKADMNHADCLFFTDSNMVSYNDRLLIQTKFELGAEAVVKASEFIQIVKRFPTGLLSLSVDSAKKELILIKGKAKAGLKLMEVPFPPMVKKEHWFAIEKSEHFKNSLAFCQTAVSRNYAKKILCHIFWNGQYMMACDGFQSSRVKFSSLPISQSLLIPETVLKTLISISGEYEFCSISNEWFSLKVANPHPFIMRIRLGSGDYPQDTVLKTLDNSESKGSPIKFPKNILKVLERADVFSKTEFENDEQIKVSVESGRMKLSSISEVGWYSQSMKIEYTGPCFEFKCRPSVFKNILGLEGSTILEHTRLLMIRKTQAYSISISHEK